MVLVVGATGYLGGLITRRLLEMNQPVRIAVRQGSNYSDLLNLGATSVSADLKDPASLSRACAGAEIVITTANSARRDGEDSVASVDRDGNAHLIKAAREAGVQKFIFTSAYGATTTHPNSLLQAKACTEELLARSGLNHTILAPHIFMDGWIPRIVGSAIQEARPVLIIGNGESKHSFIAAKDVAEFAVACIGNDLARNARLLLGGPDAYSWDDIVAMVSARLGRSVELIAVPIGQPVAQLPDLITGLLTGMAMADVRIPMEETARKFGVQLTSMEDFIASTFAR